MALRSVKNYTERRIRRNKNLIGVSLIREHALVAWDTPKTDNNFRIKML